MRVHRWVASLVILAAVSPRVDAQSASVQAESLFDDGQRLMQAGRFAEACAAFESSQKLDPVVTTLLNLADCREQNHQLATAWGTFVDANRMARAAGNDKLAHVATTHARKLEGRLSKLTIAVPADHQVPGLEVQRGAERVDPAGWNHALPIDGGTYTITARAAGHASWSVTRTIKLESDAQTIEIPKLLDARSAVAARTGGASTPPAPPAGSSGAATTTSAGPGVASSAKPGAGNAGVASSGKPSTGSGGVASSAKPGAGSAGVASSGAPSTGSGGVASSAKPTTGNVGVVSSAKPSAAGSGAASSAKPGAGRPGGVPPAGSVAANGTRDAQVAPPPVGAAGSAGAAAHVAPGSSVADASPVPATPPPAEAPDGRPFPTLPLVVGVVGVGLGGVALAFDLSGDRFYDRAQAARDQGTRDSNYQAANTRRYLAEGLTVAAVGCAGAAVYLYVRGRGGSRAEATAVTPVASPQLTGLAVAGSW